MFGLITEKFVAMIDRTVGAALVITCLNTPGITVAYSKTARLPEAV